MPIDALIVLATLKNGRRVALSELAERIQKRDSDARKTVEWLVKLGMVEGIGNEKARRYMLSSKVYALSGDETAYTRQKGMTIIQEKSMIESHIERFGQITRAEAADLCKCDKNHAYYILRQMVESGLLLSIGSGRNVRYVKKD